MSASQDTGLSDRRRPENDANQLARYRLIIDGGPQTGYVYKSVDRITGEIVSQFPHETLERLKSDPQYAQGVVIDTTA